ncbi:MULTISPECIES: helix-turn-helix transcriptional regulator [Rhodococcus]|uniref:Transcriptional regulator, XRE family n=1 Tax=Rhodococcus aetherivorans TaxID=191292 RepID=A0ABQ0YV24_9NOCA|nr:MULTISPECIES: helix-turn-helix transcriptional regulator [Rhodococcus]ETT23277.1 helix-turn-helix domain protein [Rhodococcus rhodochrous ATCC 21198]NCL73122.1 hypothetical protein [Rhodococcus sp. YH1]AKE91083.1 XRE family transcriptional regulator [Rhodococcus aetherivorans]ANZ24143.1 transcriptional regulator [Rhodococcus sp. WB1]KDE11993.1 XRE family transcriptional regulator [Rhodococcus aetherivorans]
MSTKESGEPADGGDGDKDDASGATEIATRVVSTAAQDIGSFIRSQREAAQVSLRQLSQLAGVSNPYLSQIERGLRKPSAEVLGQIAKGLRMSAEVLYVRAGILEQRPQSAVRDALLADAVLTERQKQVLLDIYESFCRENGSRPSGAASAPGTSAPEASASETSASEAAAPKGATDPDQQEN